MVLSTSWVRIPPSPPFNENFMTRAQELIEALTKSQIQAIADSVLKLAKRVHPAYKYEFSSRIADFLNKDPAAFGLFGIGSYPSVLIQYCSKHGSKNLEILYHDLEDIAKKKPH